MSPKRNPVPKQSGSVVSPLKEDDRKSREAGSVLSQASRNTPNTEPAKEVRALPKGWGGGKLQNLAVKIGSGSTPQGGEAVYKESGIRVILSIK